LSKLLQSVGKLFRVIYWITQWPQLTLRDCFRHREGISPLPVGVIMDQGRQARHVFALDQVTLFAQLIERRFQVDRISQYDYIENQP